MIRHRALSMLIVGGLLCVGCAQEAEKAKDEAKEAAAAAKGAAASAGMAAKDAAAAAAEATKEAASALGGEFSSALTSATAALKDVPGGSDALKKVTEIFTSAQTALAGATSSETAHTAMDKLAEVEGKVDGAMESLKSLPAGAKTAIASLVEKGVAHLKTLVEKVKGLDGVDEAIKTKLDAFLTKVESLKG